MVKDLCTPAEVVAHGERLRQAGALDDADRFYRGVLRDLAPLHRGLARVAIDRGDGAAAAALAAVAVTLDPEDVENVGVEAEILFKLRRYQEGLAAAERTATVAPDSGPARVLLGVGQLRTGAIAKALETFKAATAMAPGLPAAWEGLGVVWSEIGQQAEAARAFGKLVEIAPGHPNGTAHLAASLTDTGHADEALALLGGNGVVDAASLGSPALFVLNCIEGITADEVFAQHARWGAAEAARFASSSPPHGNDRTSDRRLRVGYVSPDFRAHSVSFFMLPVIATHDRREIEVICYQDEAHADEVTALVHKHADGWRRVGELSDEALARRIRDDEIDILVDLVGHTRATRLSVFARKPAPVQITYLGYPNTTGLPTIDARITDAFADPPGLTEHLHTERLVRPFSSFLCYSPLLDTPPPSPLPADGLGSMTFGSFNHRRKINEHVIRLWSRVLKAVPHSRLLLKTRPLDDETCRRALLLAFEREGIGADRIEVAPHARLLTDHLSRYRDVDIALDTFPYHGTTTTCEALWQGVPVVTLAGDRHASRVGVSILNNVGLPELVATDDDDFVRRAAELAEDTNRLRQLRYELRERLRCSALFDALGFTRGLEAVYRDLWRSFCERP